MANRVELTAAYHKLSGASMEAAAKLARDKFLNLGSWRDEDVTRYLEQVTPVIQNNKKTIANLTTGYYSKIAEVSKEKFTVPSITPQMLSTEALRNGSTAEMIWQRPFKQMWTKLKRGEDFSTALQSGADRATSIARTEMQLAKRGAGLYARNANDRIIGYIRTLSGSENCALCYVASTQRYTRGDLLPIHPGCDCGELPIYGTKDIGQVIDQENLDKAHEAIAERFGISDRGAREPDYRKITIHEHGEIGPYLGVKGQKFTKLKPSQLDKPIKAPTAVPDSAKKTFAEKIQTKLNKISPTTIADDIIAEHGDVNVKLLKGKNKIQDLGDKTKAHLQAIKDLGKDVDDEISNRVKFAINELSNPAEIASIEKSIKLGEEILARTEIQFEAGIQQLISSEQAKIQARASARVKELLADGFDQDYVDNFLNNFYSPEKIMREAKENAERTFRFSKPGRALFDEIQEYKKDLEGFRQSLPGNILPGTEKYGQIYAAKAKEVLSEVRSLGAGGPNLVGSQKVADIINEAKQVYPSDWLAKAADKYKNLQIKEVARGYFKDLGGELAVSFNRSTGFAKGYATAVHEMGHMFEYSVPGIKQVEFAFAHERAALDTKRSNLGSREAGFTDKWRNLYTGKDYGYGTNDAYEIFTTGIESIFAGSDMFAVPKNRSMSTYFNQRLGAQAPIDDEFRHVVLGMLFGL